MKCTISRCKNTNIDKHHIKTRGSGGTDDDWNLVELCRLHHSEIHQIGNWKFCQKYPEFLSVLKSKGWTYAAGMGVIKLERL